MKWYRRPYSAIIQRCRDFTILQFEKFCYGNTIISLQPFPWQWRGGNKGTREWSLVFDFLLMKKHYFAINRSFTFDSMNWARFMPFVLISIELRHKAYSILTYILLFTDWSLRCTLHRFRCFNLIIVHSSLDTTVTGSFLCNYKKHFYL